MITETRLTPAWAGSGPSATRMRALLPTDPRVGGERTSIYDDLAPLID